MKNTGRNRITTDPLTEAIDAHVSRVIQKRPLESELDFQLRRDAELFRLHFAFQQFLDSFLHNREDREFAIEIFLSVMQNDPNLLALKPR